MYLLPIFSSKDIVMQLPEEEILFSQVDMIYRKTMQNVTDFRVCETAGSVRNSEVYYIQICNIKEFLKTEKQKNNFYNSYYIIL